MPEQLFVFTSDTCHSCHVLLKSLEKENIPFTEVNVCREESQSLVKKYYVHSTPTLVALNKNEATSKIGFQSIRDVKNFLNLC
jgi:glutaredoxin